MQNIATTIQKSFEDIKMQDDTGFEFWSARDLMTALGYKKWERFSLVIRKAKENCQNANGVINDHFLDQKEFFQYAGKTLKGGRRKNNLSGKFKLEKELIDNSKITRKTLLARGIKPEELKPQEDLKHIEKRRENEKKILGSKSNLLED